MIVNIWHQQFLSQGLLSSYDASIGGKVEVGLNTSYLELSTSGSDKVIAIRQDGITESEISSNATKWFTGGRC